MAQTQNYGTGKRKTAVARVFLRPGNGTTTINGRPFDEYFTTVNQRELAKEALQAVDNASQFDFYITVKGGGLSGQAGAIRHGITRALILADPELRLTLKRAGFIRRDSRVKERKKYGQKGARARYQFSKR